MRRVRSVFTSARLQTVLPIALVIAAAAALVYAATPDRASSWRDNDIRIDGSDEEWKGEELPVKGQHFSLGIANDGEWLYLCLPTKDSGTKAMIERAGLVIWVDPEGGKKQRFGVHFPVPNPPGTRPRREVPPPPGSAPAEGQPQEVGGQEQVGVLGPGKNDAQLVAIDEAGGIEAKVGVHGDLMVYEVKLPLARSGDHPYAPNVGPGQRVRLEIETAPMRANMATMPPGPPPAGRPWGPAWGGITIGGRKPVFAVPFDVTMNVQLAKEPTGK